MNKIIFSLFLLFILANSIYTAISPFDDIPEITKEITEEFEKSYRETEDADARGYFEPVIKPEKFDINKDRKISRNEIRKAIIYVVYPKDEKKMIGADKNLLKHVRNNIDLYVKSLKKDHLNYKEFAYLMATISARDFLAEEMVKDIQEAKKAKIEPSLEL